MSLYIPLSTLFASGPALLLIAGVVLVERRGRREPLDPTRQIEIRTLLDSMPESVVIVNAESKIVDANATALKLSSLSRDQLLGMPVGEFARRMEGDGTNKVVEFRRPIVSRALAGEAVQAEKRELRNPSTGEALTLLVSANPIRNERGEVLGALLVARDVTELDHLHQRLADTDRHQAIGHVAAGIAHDFNNTLQTISQAVAVLQMTPNRPPSEQKIFLDMIDNAVRRGAEVISRIRDYLRSGKSVPGEIELQLLIEDAIQLTKPMWQAAAITIHRELKPVAKVRGNPADIRRVFTNLIINAVQAMPFGGQMTVGCEDLDRVVHAWVRDTGHGISTDARKQVFNPYFTTKPGGTGLGLSGAQKILLELGGNISFQTEPGKGTQFDLYFPKQDTLEKRTA